MDKELWDAVDSYISETLIPRDEVLDETLSSSAAAGLPAIHVAANQGKMLHLFARMCGAKRILEIGTLGAYSTIWLARAIPPDGKLITLEAEPKHAEVAIRNIQRAGLSTIVELRQGPALGSLKQLWEEKTPPFDLIFIDADKPNNPAYLEWSIRLSRPGTVMVCDNVVRKGGLIDPASSDPQVQGTRRFFEMLSLDRRLDATAVQTVGSKGYDGFALVLVRETA